MQQPRLHNVQRRAIWAERRQGLPIRKLRALPPSSQQSAGLCWHPQPAPDVISPKRRGTPREQCASRRMADQCGRSD